MSASADKYSALQTELSTLPFISPAQVERWVALQKTIDGTRDFLIRAVPEARINIETAQKILAQRTYTLVFFGGTGVGKSTLINALLGRNLLPTGAVTAVTGTIVYVEEARPDEAETLTLTYWSKDEFAERVRRLCQLAELPPFNITNDGERDVALASIQNILTQNRESAKTERDEYLEILLDCIATYENHRELFKADTPPPQVYTLDQTDVYKHLREDGFKGSAERQIRLIKAATFRIHQRTDQPDLLLNGYLRIVDVPGLGAGMRLHEAITLEEMKKEDAMIVLVTDAGRQRVDESKSLAAVHWVKDNRLRGLKGADLDDAAAKIFYVVNGGNIRQAFDRLNSGLPSAEYEVKEVTRHIAPNYWEQYKDRGNGRPYFLVMPPVALYVQDPENAPHEFQTETERVLKAFKDQLDGVNADPLDPDTKTALLELSELPRLREGLISFIKTQRIRTQLREAESRVLAALHALKAYYEKELAARNVYPPFEISWESLQERRFENLMQGLQKELPRAFHAALVDLSRRTNNEDSFRRMVRPILAEIEQQVQANIADEVDVLLEQYGTEHWDNRDVTYDNLIWGISGIELPIKRILYQVELRMQEAVSKNMPRLAGVMTSELRRTMQAHEIRSRLERAAYGQSYSYTLPHAPAELFDLASGYDALLQRVETAFRQVCEQAAMYELMRAERSVHQRLNAARPDPLAGNAQLLDAALRGPSAEAPAPANGPRTAEPAAEEEIAIRILDQESEPELTINMVDEATAPAAAAAAEQSYADLLDDVAGKTKQIFAQLVNDLFRDDDLLPRLRRLFWLEATRAERDFNNHLVKPLLRQHDRRLHDDALRAAMEPDLESVSELETLMRTWEGLDKLERSAV